jgi:hypothetical protein
MAAKRRDGGDRAKGKRIAGADIDIGLSAKAETIRQSVPKR